MHFNKKKASNYFAIWTTLSKLLNIYRGYIAELFLQLKYFGLFGARSIFNKLLTGTYIYTRRVLQSAFNCKIASAKSFDYTQQSKFYYRALEDE